MTKNTTPIDIEHEVARLYRGEDPETHVSPFHPTLTAAGVALAKRLGLRVANARVGDTYDAWVVWPEEADLRELVGEADDAGDMAGVRLYREAADALRWADRQNLDRAAPTDIDAVVAAFSAIVRTRMEHHEAAVERLAELDPGAAEYIRELRNLRGSGGAS